MKISRFLLLSTLFGVLAFLAPKSRGAAPLNDFYLKAAAISGDSGSMIGSIAEASAENGEPLHAQAGGNSVWFSWTPAVSGAAVFDTVGSSFDTALAVYTGRSLVSAVLVAENDDDIAANLSTSRVQFPVIAGATYRIVVAGPDAGTTFTLNWTTLPNGVVRFARENFSANEASGTAVIALERIGAALGALNVPLTFPASVTDSATPGVDFDATPLVASFGAGQTTATVSIPLTADSDLEGDETVELALGIAGSGGALEPGTTAVLTIRDAQDDPANDLLANAIVLSGAGGQENVDNTTAGVEAGEPAHVGVTAGRSLWFTFTPLTNGALLLDTGGSVVDGRTEALDTVIDVFTGPAVNALTAVAANDNAGDDLNSRLVLPVTGGMTYAIAIDSRDDAGQIKLKWAFATGGFLQFSQPEYAVGDDVTTATISVSRLGSTAGTVGVNYATVQDLTVGAESAIAGTHYVATPAGGATLNLGAGEASKSFTVVLLTNTAIDGDKSLSLALSLPTGGALIGEPAAATLRIEDTPDNDKFAAATVLAGVTDVVNASNEAARMEVGEPQHGGPGGHSIWFKWRAPANGAVVFDTGGSVDGDSEPLDTLLAAYTGAAVNSVIRVAGNDNSATSVTSRMAFRVTGGTTYYIAVDGRGGVVGDIEMSWSFSTKGLLQFSQPFYQVNENGGVAIITVVRSDAAALDPVSVDVSAEGGTATDVVDFRSPSIGTLNFNAGEVSRSFTIPIIADSINEVDETVQLSLISGESPLGERFVATLTINDRLDDPANDYFDNAAVLTGNEGQTFGVTTGASREPGEGLHGGVLGNRSVWFRWTPALAGRASLETAGSVGSGGGALDTVLAVYTGGSLPTPATLVPLVANDDVQPGVKTSRVSFNTTAGVTYYIAVDSTGADGGEVSLAWALGSGGLLQFRQPQYVVRENAGKVTITVDRTGPTNQAVSAIWTVGATPDGKTTPGVDFPAASGVVSFPVGATSASFDVAVTDDSFVEEDESFAVTLSDPTGGATFSSTTVSATLVIDDNDTAEPANNNFASAVVVAGNSGSVTGVIDGAGTESGEPASAAGHTIWYRWTAPANGAAQFDTAGSGSGTARLDTILTAFTGTSLGALQALATNDDAVSGDVTSRIRFTVLAGVTYSIAVDAREPLGGDVRLNWALTTGGSIGFNPRSFRVNETAGSAQILVSRSGTNVSSATVEYETVDGTAVAPTNYATRRGTLTFTPGQTTATLAIPIVNNAVGEMTFRVRLKNPSSGATLGVDSAEVRIFDLNDNPANDTFAGATLLVGEGDSVVSSNLGAGKDAGEALPSPLLQSVGGGRTVWFRWKAPATGSVTFSTDGSTEQGTGDALDTVIAAFTGSDPTKLTLIGQNDESPDAPRVSALTFRAIYGKVYTIVVDSVGDRFGDVDLSWSIEADPGGDGLLLAPVPGFTPSIIFRDRFSQTLKSDGSGGFDTIDTNTISATFVLALREVDVSGLDAETPVEVAIGDFSQSGVLGDDPAYRPGRRSASFPLLTTNNAGNDKKVGSVTYSWTATTLTIKIAASGSADFPIYAPSYGGAGIETTGASASFAGVSGLRTIYVTGTSKTKVVTKAGGDEFELITTDVSGTADYAVPIVTSNAPGAVTETTETINLSGTAADNYSLAEVSVRVNGQEPVAATLVTSPTLTSGTWTLAGIPLPPGRNTIEVDVTDESGNVGTLLQLVNRPRPVPLSLRIIGQGRIATSFAGTLVNVGSPYTVTATPAVGWLFRGWTGTDGSRSGLPAFAFSMIEGLELTAEFIPNPFVGLSGIYAGFVRSSNALPGDTGIFSVSVTASGALTVSFILGAKRSALTGVFDADGNFTVSLPPRRTGGSPVVITLHLDVTSGSEQITGTVTDGSFISGVTADRRVFDSAIHPLAGLNYTALLTDSDGVRGNANAFLTATVASNGAVRFAGALADNLGVGGSGFLSRSGVVQIYASMSRGGALVGALAFAPATAGTVQGAFAWYRTTEAVTNLAGRGEVFVSPTSGSIFPTLPGGQTTAEVGGLALIPTTQQSIRIGADNKVTLAAQTPGLSRITIDAKTGLLTATGRQQNGRSFNVRGVVLQKSAVGAGFINLREGVGYMLIGAP